MEQYNNKQYYAKKSFWKLFGGEIRIFDINRSRILFYVKQKAFKLKEDITVYGDESKNVELMKIKARSIIDFSAAYDVTDANTGSKIGALKRKGMKSILKDEWDILDANDQSIGIVQENSMLLALLRRFLTNLIPQKFTLSVGGQEVGYFRQTFNPFVPQFEIDFSMDSSNLLDRRLGIATVILLQTIEGRQN
ncbi:MAG: hypothetical protein GW938_06115 [Leptospira sp.]|nr:hypothetical protein [Leptospira sp.]NCS92624.1 hypothetical protein [Leptospira sp.]